MAAVATKKREKFKGLTFLRSLDINSQHHNLLGNQISPKLEDFCILTVILD
jgi:hypothetical protein